MTTTDSRYDHHRGAQPLLRLHSRGKAALFVAVNFAAFVFVNAFWRYLTSGNWLEFSWAAMRRELTSPLGEMFIHPLNVFAHPWMILVSSLLLAAVISVPVLLAVLYPAAVAAAFVVVVAAAARAPVLAAAVGLGCFLAARTRLRSDMPFLAVLLGLAPVGLYFYFFGFGLTESAAVRPLQQWVLTGPFVIAMVLAVLASAIVLELAKLTGFRPGVLTPVLMLLLAAPVGVFMAKVGPAELEYNVIAGKLSAGDAMHQLPLQQWLSQRQDHVDGRELDQKLRRDLLRYQQELMAKCEGFLRRHGASSRAPAIAWVLAQAASLQLDQPAVEKGLVRYVASHPSPASEDFWRQLRETYGDSPQTACAHWRLGQLALRRGRPQEAAGHLRGAANRLRRILDKPPEEPDKLLDLFYASPSGPPRAYYETAKLAVDRLILLMDRNNILADQAAADALAEYLNINPCEAGYAEKVQALLERTPLVTGLVAPPARPPAGAAPQTGS